MVVLYIILELSPWLLNVCEVSIGQDFYREMRVYKSLIERCLSEAKPSNMKKKIMQKQNKKLLVLFSFLCQILMSKGVKIDHTYQVYLSWNT